MTNRTMASGVWLFLLIALALQPAPALAQCSTGDFMAVFVLGGLDPGFENPQAEILSVTPVGEATYPPESTVYQNVMTAFNGEVNPAIQSAGPYGDLTTWVGLQHSSQALTDRRDGAVLFAGSVVWMGQGHIYAPAASTHAWQTGGILAPAPGSVTVIDNPDWPDSGGATNAELADMAVAYLRTTDVLVSFGTCGSYAVTSWVYTPTLGVLNPAVAKLIVVVEGRIGAPWNGQVVPTVAESWGSVKSLYR